MTAQTYLLYVTTGHEFEASENLADLAQWVWCARKIEWQRRGKKRYPDPIEKPILPNYVFANLTAHQFYDAQAMKWVGRTLMPLSAGDERGLLRFRERADAEYETQDRARRNGEVVRSEFEPGEALQIIGGPFAEKAARFRKIVEKPGQMHPKVEVDLEDGWPISLDPLDVRRAG